MDLQNAEEKLDRFIKEDATYLIERSEEILNNLNQNVLELKRHINELKRDLIPADYNNRSFINNKYTKSCNNHNDFNFIEKQKIFRSRQSGLTEMLQVDDYKAVYHIFVSIFILYGFAIFISDLYDSEYMMKFELITSGFANAPHMIFVWTLMFCSSFLILPLYSIWIRNYISSSLFIILYLSLQISMFGLASIFGTVFV